MTIKKKIYADLYRCNGGKGIIKLIDTAIRKRNFRYICYLRWYQSKKLRSIARLFLRHICSKTSIEIGWKTSIGPGLQLVHSGNIAVNNDAVIGDNCTIYPGVIIGMEFRGKRIGNPTIGNNVWIGPNAVIVGDVTIGDDVLIAPLTYVNFDVPSHSVVLGNPGVIKPKENATEKYIVRTDYQFVP